MELAAYIYDAWAYEQAGQELSDRNYICDHSLHCDLPPSNDWNFQAVKQKCCLLSAIALTSFGNLALPAARAAHQLEPAVNVAPWCNNLYLCDTSYILEVQTLLSQRGFAVGAIDGVYGRHTKQAVIDFQKTQPSLAADGIPGAQTLARLRNPSRPNSQNQISNSGNQRIVIVRPNPNQDNINQGFRLINSQQPELDDIGNLQILLKQRGFYQGAIDSQLGQETTNAVLKSQRAYGLVADGVVGPSTIRALLAGGNHVPLTQPPLNRLPPSENIVQAQYLLRERGFYGGEINGLYNALTKSSIFEAQLAYAQKPTGELDSALLAALRAQDLTQPLPTISQNPLTNSNLPNSGNINVLISPQVNFQPLRPSQSSTFSSSQNAPLPLPPTPNPSS
ncbi:MAG: hypothetical protein DCE90_01025 [Pseudanabaena sp.]|nr:MAG: hypothetical protein DCE90_01025 [Pseudanabaena sp.]